MIDKLPPSPDPVKILEFVLELETAPDIRDRVQEIIEMINSKRDNLSIF